MLPVTRFCGSKLVWSHRHSASSSSSASPPKNCVIFLHGSGASGSDIANAVDPLLRRLPDTVILYPTAPLRPYSLLDGQLSRVWHDRKGLDPEAPEDSEGIGEMGTHLARLVSEINIKMNIPNSRIVVGGFSQGGHMAMHLGLRGFLAEPPAGVFALSSFLAEGSAVYEAVRIAEGEGRLEEMPPLFMAHGKADWLVSVSWAQRSFELLRDLGMTKAKYLEFDGDHEVVASELKELYSWLEDRFAES